MERPQPCHMGAPFWRVNRRMSINPPIRVLFVEALWGELVGPVVLARLQWRSGAPAGPSRRPPDRGHGHHRAELRVWRPCSPSQTVYTCTCRCSGSPGFRTVRHASHPSRHPVDRRRRAAQVYDLVLAGPRADRLTCGAALGPGRLRSSRCWELGIDARVAKRSIRRSALIAKDSFESEAAALSDAARRKVKMSYAPRRVFRRASGCPMSHMAGQTTQESPAPRSLQAHAGPHGESDAYRS